MYEDFGAVPQNGAVTFTVFFPDNTIAPDQYQRGGTPRIKSMRVTGDFQSANGGTNWDHLNAPLMNKTAHLKGWTYTCTIPAIPDGFYQYKYFVEFENGTTRWCSDPCSKYGGFENENSGFVTGGKKPALTQLLNRLPASDLIIYEMMLEDFTAGYRGDSAPLDAVWKKLDYLQELGINAIEFMPWTTWPEGEFSWGYDPVSFFSVEYNYYNDDAQPLVKLGRLQTLINELHRRNIHVIMDGVFNHANAGTDPNKGFAYFWLYQDPADSPYIGNFGEGGFFNEFDFSNNCTDEFIIDVCAYWIKYYGIDGIRFDYVKGFYVANDPDQGIGEIILYLKNFAKSSELENISLSLELLPDDRYMAIDETNTIDADACWYDPLFWEAVTNAVHGNVQPALLRALHTGRDFKTGKVPVVYMENHDHSTLTEWAGGRQQWWMTQPLAIALFTVCGATFLHNGQEYGEQYYLPESGMDRVIKRPLHWQEAEDNTGQSIYNLYQQLIRIRKENSVLRGYHFYPDITESSGNEFNDSGYGISSTRGLAVYHRWGDDADGKFQRYIILLNFSSSVQTLRLAFSENGNWQNLLEDFTVAVNDYCIDNYSINSHWGAIFQFKG